MKKIFLLIFLILSTALLSSLSYARDYSAQNKFSEANLIFEKGDLDTAYQIYEELLQKGFVGSSLFYNLGNYFYRQGERGKAVLWYERARALAPRDSDVKFNLSLAQSHIKKGEPHFIEKLILTLTPNELSMTSLFFIISFFILLGCVTLGWVQAEVWPTVTLWISGILLVVSLSWLGLNLNFRSKPWAIVTSLPGEVRNGPGIDFAVGFTIPEGSKVLILNKRPEWTQIGAPQEGLKGWIPTQEIEEIQLKPRLG